MQPEIVLDLSRLLSRVLHRAPTGIDRVEMAYARGLAGLVPDRLSFAALHPAGVYGRLDGGAVAAFLQATEDRWEGGSEPGGSGRRRFAFAQLATLRPRGVPRPAGPRVWLKPSPNGLTRPGQVRAIKARESAKLVCLLHDLIPVEFPEYARPGGAALHAKRLATVAELAEGVLANSAATLAGFQRWAGASRTMASRVAHLGVDLLAAPAPRPLNEPYFVCLGTIEPRKNHLLLLHLWRTMVERRGAAAVPKLLLIGRRGWENEQVLDLLDRCPALAGVVSEHGGLPDVELRALLAGARALLLPSFAEGFGMPVAEAQAMGVPVICSDLPALREASGGVAEFLDPLDGPGWLGSIDDYCTDTPRRSAQLDRLAGWTAPTWAEHLAIVMDLLDDLGA